VKITALFPGFDSAITAPYDAAGQSEYGVSFWASAPTRPQHLHAFLIFYGSAHEVLSIEQAPVYTRVSRRWTRLTVRALSPDGTAFVAVGVDDADGDAAFFLDDATLTGSTGFTYEAPR
jgi:hypothetical protein